jgi:hypothetical protein
MAPLTALARADPDRDVLRGHALQQLRDLHLGHGRDEVMRQVDACSAHLVARFVISGELAADIALQAWAEIEGKRGQAHFDLEASTPYLVFITDNITGQRRAISVADLLRILGPRTAARPGAVG